MLTQHCSSWQSCRAVHKGEQRRGWWGSIQQLKQKKRDFINPSSATSSLRHFSATSLWKIKHCSVKVKAHVPPVLQDSLTLSLSDNRRACPGFFSWFSMSRSKIKVRKASLILSEDVACRVQDWRNIRKWVKSFWDHHLELARVLLSARLPPEAD